MTKRLAIVTPFYVNEAAGDVPRLARELARGLADRGHRVDVLTTCARSLEPDAADDPFPPGVEVEGPLSLRRFPVVAHAPGGDPVAPALTGYVRESRLDYDAMLFLPLRAGTTRQGIPAAGNRAFLLPLLDDDADAAAPEAEQLAHGVRGLLFAGRSEALLARRLWGPAVGDKSRLVGSWIDPPAEFCDARVGDFDPTAARYVLYLGRRDEIKNVGFALKAFREFRAARPETELAFVLAGPGGESFSDPAAGIHDLADVSAGDRRALLAHALAVVQPSYDETDPRLMWEAWSYGRPVAVNASCLAMTPAVERCRGGWTAGPKTQWVKVFSEIADAGAAQLDAIGRRGYEQYAANATIERVLERYEHALGLIDEPSSASRGNVIVACGPFDRCADGGYTAANLCASLRRAGFEVVPLALGTLPEAGLPLIVEAEDANTADLALEHPGPLLALFTTPSPIRDDRIADVLARASVVVTTERSVDYARDFRVNRPAVLPLAADPAYWDRMPDPGLMETLADGKVTILCVGPLGEGSGAADAIAAFSFLIAMHCDARMVFVDDASLGADADALGAFVERHGLTPRITIETLTTPERLAAYYRSASVYFSMSERDDTLGALIDAMLFDVPILAYGTPRVRELLGPAGIIVSSRSEPAKLGALVRELVRDQRLRRAVIAAQHARRCAYDRHLLDVYVEGIAGALRPISIPETA